MFLGTPFITEDPLPKVQTIFLLKIFPGSPLPFNYIQLSTASITAQP